MREMYHDVIKSYVRSELLKTRSTLGLTQEEMAHKLIMSTRSYVDLEGGKSGCSIVTFWTYLHRCCPNPETFITGLFYDLDHSFIDVI